MYNFILEIALMLGLGTMIYMVARAVPRIGDEIPETHTKVDRFFASIPLHRADALLNNFLEKFLRKIKLVLMKLDNSIVGYLDKIKKINGNGKKNGEERPTLFNNGNGNGHKEEGGVLENQIEGDGEINQALHNTNKEEQI